MKTDISGNNYNYKILINRAGRSYLFEIIAICKISGRYSFINNLNTILSEFDIPENDVKFIESTWLLAKNEVKHYFEFSNILFSSKQYIDYLEKQLDEDRSLGEWERII